MFRDLYGYQFQQTNRQTQIMQSREFTSRNPKTIAFPSDKHSRPIITFKQPIIKLTKSNRPDLSHITTSLEKTLFLYFKILQKKNKTLITQIFRSQKKHFSLLNSSEIVQFFLNIPKFSKLLYNFRIFFFKTYLKFVKVIRIFKKN